MAFQEKSLKSLLQLKDSTLFGDKRGGRRRKKKSKLVSFGILLMVGTKDKRGYLVETHAACWVMHSCFWHPNCHLVPALISLKLSSRVFSPALRHIRKDPHHTERNLQAACLHSLPSWLKAICESDLSLCWNAFWLWLCTEMESFPACSWAHYEQSCICMIITSGSTG